MSERTKMMYCPNCDKVQPTLVSGSGRKAYCDVCGNEISEEVQYVSEPKKRYYIRWFYPDYDTEHLKILVKDAGGERPRTALLHGWSNQPEVVTFTASEGEIKEIEYRLMDRYPSAIVYEKDW